jgi:hypothetical protein
LRPQRLLSITLAVGLFVGIGLLHSTTLASILTVGGSGSSGLRMSGGVDGGGSIPKATPNTSQGSIVSLIGRITDPAGIGLADYSVEVRNASGQVVDVATSDDHGYFGLEVPNELGMALDVLGTSALDIPVFAGDLILIVLRN